MNILVADDSAVIRCVIRRALAELGCETCDDANDGKIAIDMIKSNDYQLIITDWNMPGYSGIDVIKAARAKGFEGPIVMQTTNSCKSHIMEALSAGANDFILKPFNTADLVERLERHVCNAAMLTL